MTNEDYLNQVGILSRRIVYHTERLNRMRREADAVRSIRYGRIGGTAGNNDAPYIRILERIEEYEEELEGENKLYLDLQAQVEQVLSTLPEEQRLVLMYRYLEGMSYRYIGEILYVDSRTVRRWHASALNQLTLPDEAIRIH